jgi:hypothetical protein
MSAERFHKKIIIAIHQPNYLPWLGTFHKMYYADKFVFHDMIQFSKSDYTKRVKIRKFRDAAWLSVPLKRHSTATPIKEIEVDASLDWVKKHLNAIKGNYANAPYFKQYYPVLTGLLGRAASFKYLADLNIFLMLEIAGLLGIGGDTAVARSSELGVSGRKTTLNINIIKRLGGDLYLSGTEAKDYQDEDEFRKNSIKLIYQNIFEYLSAHPYHQSDSEFLNGLSIIDALLNIGADGIMGIFRSFDEEMRKARLLQPVRTE